MKVARVGVDVQGDRWTHAKVMVMCGVLKAGLGSLPCRASWDHPVVWGNGGKLVCSKEPRSICRTRSLCFAFGMPPTRQGTLRLLRCGFWECSPLIAGDCDVLAVCVCVRSARIAVTGIHQRMKPNCSPNYLFLSSFCFWRMYDCKPDSYEVN